MKINEEIAKMLEQPGWAVSVLVAPDGAPVMASMWAKDIVVSQIQSKKKRKKS